jgi:hypothetical protein
MCGTASAQPFYFAGLHMMGPNPRIAQTRCQWNSCQIPGWDHCQEKSFELSWRRTLIALDWLQPFHLHAIMAQSGVATAQVSQFVQQKRPMTPQCQFVELTNGDKEEQDRFGGLPNFHGLHGNAVLTRCRTSSQVSPAGLLGHADPMRHYDGVNEAPEMQVHGFPCCYLVQLNADYAFILYF